MHWSSGAVLFDTLGRCPLIDVDTCNEMLGRGWLVKDGWECGGYDNSNKEPAQSGVNERKRRGPGRYKNRQIAIAATCNDRWHLIESCGVQNGYISRSDIRHLPMTDTEGRHSRETFNFLLTLFGRASGS